MFLTKWLLNIHSIFRRQRITECTKFAKVLFIPFCLCNLSGIASEKQLLPFHFTRERTWTACGLACLYKNTCLNFYFIVSPFFFLYKGAETPYYLYLVWVTQYEPTRIICVETRADALPPYFVQTISKRTAKNSFLLLLLCPEFLARFLVLYWWEIIYCW